VQNYLEKVTAIYDYNADKEDELTFQVRFIYQYGRSDPGLFSVSGSRPFFLIRILI
jgi:hypothetical protein